MAKIRRYKLSWEPSDSNSINGYRIYWSESENVNYDSKSIDVGNVTELILSDDPTSSGSTVMFGVAAIDRDGNESDITTMANPYHFHIPTAPKGLSILPLNDFRIVDQKKSRPLTLDKLDEVSLTKKDDDDPLAEAIESRGESQRPQGKYYDDIGYRNKP